MNLETGNLQKELEFQLKEAGLPIDSKKIIGQMYRFECEHGSHHHILVGIIKAIEISDEGGLDLYVTNPRFWGRNLISIMYDNGKWMVYIDYHDEPGQKKTTFEGNFHLL